MQFGQAAQDERRDVPVVAIFRGTVLIRGDSDLGGSRRTGQLLRSELVDRKDAGFTNGKYGTIRS
jgi:hypothetical protein